jgi:hypothetical protein
MGRLFVPGSSNRLIDKAHYRLLVQPQRIALKYQNVGQDGSMTRNV